MIENNAAAQALLCLTRPYDRSMTPEKTIALDINTVDSLYDLPVMLLLCTGMHFVWENRVNRRNISLDQIWAELECLVSLLRRSMKMLKEAGEMIHNTMVNFPINNVNLSFVRIVANMRSLGGWKACYNKGWFYNAMHLSILIIKI